MAGSYQHIVGEDGKFTKALIECGTGDCEEALQDCFNIITDLKRQNAILLAAVEKQEPKKAVAQAVPKPINCPNCEHSRRYSYQCKRCHMYSEYEEGQ